MKNIIILGGGAAGLMAGIQAARQGAAVTILEQNEKPGKKLLVTGNGKCNLTNLHQRPADYRSSEPQLAWQLLQQFSVQDTLDFFEEIGVYPKNRNGGIYPNSEQAATVLEVLLLEAAALKIKIKTHEKAVSLKQTAEGWLVRTEGWQYEADAVLVTTGGLASQVEGSSDCGCGFAESLGIRTVSRVPALTALKGVGSYFSKWAGVRTDGRIRLYANDKLLDEARGELQLTEYGISGIPVFQVSRYAARALEEQKKVTAELNFFPELSRNDLLALLQKRQQSCPYKSSAQSLIGLLPEKLLAVLAPKKADFSQIAENMQEFKIEIKETRGFSQAQVTAGGVLLSELSAHLESKKHQGLFFAGEVLDVDGTCGGYNLQWAWTSGAVAGRQAAKEEL